MLILKDLHDQIDRATADAYGWPHDLTDEQILEKLVALNAERAKEEAAGHVRWLRPDYQIPRFAKGAAAPKSGELDLGDAVTLHGYTPDAPEQSRTAALLLLTSVYEGQSLAITEAMARGCPAVSYDIAYGPGELITDGETGRLVPAGDIAALADAVLGMLGNATEIDRLSRASLDWALANGPERALARWKQLFADLAGRTPRALSS